MPLSRASVLWYKHYQNTRGYKLWPLPLFRQKNTEPGNAIPWLKTYGHPQHSFLLGDCLYGDTEGWGAEGLCFQDASPCTGSSVVGEESTEGAEQPRAHGRHSPSTLTVGKDTEQYSLEEKCQDVQRAVFCCYTGVFPSIMRLPSEHMALSFLFLLLAQLDAKQLSKTKKGVCLPTMEGSH